MAVNSEITNRNQDNKILFISGGSEPRRIQQFVSLQFLLSTCDSVRCFQIINYRVFLVNIKVLDLVPILIKFSNNPVSSPCKALDVLVNVLCRSNPTVNKCTTYLNV